MKDKVLIASSFVLIALGLAVLFILSNPQGFHEFQHEATQNLFEAIGEVWIGVKLFVLVAFLFGCIYGALLAHRLWSRRHVHIVGHTKHGPTQAVIVKGVVHTLTASAQAADAEKLLRLLMDAQKHPLQGEAVISEAAPLALNTPKEAIDAVVHYADVEHQIPASQSLLGIHPTSGDLELVNFERYKTVWFVGGSDTGKTNTVYGKVQEAVERIHAKLIICDPHKFKPDSLSNKLAGFTPVFLRPIAQTTEEIVASLEAFKAEFTQRLNGGDCSQKVLLVVDEVNNLNRNEQVRKLLKDIVFICGEESRGFGMYGYFISQKAAHLKWLRDSALTIIVHALLQESEAELAANGDAKLAKLVMQFKKGRTLIYGYDFEPMVLQQPLYQIAAPLQPSASTDEIVESEQMLHFTQGLKRDEVERDTEKILAQKKEDEDPRLDAVLERMVQGTSVNQIIKDVWGLQQSGGGAYQAALVELREIQKVIAQRAKVK